MDIEEDCKDYTKDYDQHPINLYHTIRMYPDRIKHISCQGSRLYVAREHYSEIFNILVHNDKIFFDELQRLEKCEYLLNLQDSIVMVKSFEVKIFDGHAWKTFPYSAEMRTISRKVDVLYTHHLNGECRRWDVEELTYSIVGGKETPYHISMDGVKGHSRSLKGNFTCICETEQYLYLGDTEGALSIYETKYLTFVSSQKRHSGPILAIISHNNCIYVTGCDSKIIAVKQINDRFVVSSETRGQSHDILSLCFTNDNMLVSGGLSTDLCYYKINNGDFAGKAVNRPSLTSQRLTSSDNARKLILANQLTHLELWKYNINASETDLLLRF